METAVDRLFLDFSIRRFEHLLSRIGDCVAKLTTEQVWMRSGEHENAVGNLLLHLNGNVRQWIVAGIGGQPDRRVRDLEFATRGNIEPAELMQRLSGTVGEAVEVLRRLNPDRLTESYQPQRDRVTILEGIYHVVEHFAMHTGQIMFVTKLLTGQDLGFFKHLNPPAQTEKAQ